MPKHIMLDLETYGLRPGCIILSIGAVAFDIEGLHEEYYDVIDLHISRLWKFTEDAGTVRWWDQQSPEARKAIFECPNPSRPDIAVKAFSTWVKITEAKSVWSNGGDFDIPILQAYYDETGGTWPFKYFNHRCFRTLKALCPEHAKDEGTKHNALEDAKAEARYAVECFKWLKTVL